MAVPVKAYPKVKKIAYEDIREEIRSGDILLCSGQAVFSKLIQKATDSVWSHVGFILRLDSIDRVMVLESVESVGVRTVPLSHYMKDYSGTGKGYEGKVYIARHSLFEEKAKEKLPKLSQFAVDLFGYPYDKDEIAKIAARIVAAKLGFKKNEIKRDREYICSEYAWECFKSIGLTIPHDSAGFIAPKDFAAAKEVDAMFEVKIG